MTSSSLSNSIEGKFNTINNIRGSKVVKIKTITKKNENPKYNIKQNTKYKLHKTQELINKQINIVLKYKYNETTYL